MAHVCTGSFLIHPKKWKHASLSSLDNHEIMYLRVLADWGESKLMKARLPGPAQQPGG
jgi:hypothetical protein